MVLGLSLPIALFALILVGVHRLALRFVLVAMPNRGEDLPKLRKFIDLLIWGLLWIAVGFSYLKRIAADVQTRPGFLRLDGSDQLTPWVLPILLFSLFALAVSVRWSSLQRYQARLWRYASTGALLILATGFLYIDLTYLTGYYDLYHRVIGYLAIALFGILAERVLSNSWMEFPESSRIAAITTSGFAIGGALSLFLVFSAKVYSNPENVSKVLFETTYLRRAAKQIQKITDQDGDGFPRLLGATDPDDSDPSIHPLAVEIPGDGVDQDGDGSDRTLAEDRILRSRLTSNYGLISVPHPGARSSPRHHDRRVEKRSH